MTNFDELKAAIVAAAEKYGIKEYTISFARSSSVSCETLKDEISNFTSSGSVGVGFRCIIDGRAGYASTELCEKSEMERLVTAARDTALYTEKEDTVGIFPGSPSYPEIKESGVVIPGNDEIKRVALEIQRENYAASDKVTDGTQSGVGGGETYARFCNSYGLDLEARIKLAAGYSYAVVKDGDECESWSKSKLYGKDFAAAELAGKTVEKALERVGATDNVPSGKYDVVIDAPRMRAMLSTFSPAFSSKQAQLGMSPVAGKEGQKIAADIVTVSDDPLREGLIAKFGFDGEGVATFRKNVIENGVLKTLLYNRETAKKAGVETTGNASSGESIGVRSFSLCIEAGDKTFDELMDLAGNGILITEIKGLHAGADAVTGDFSLECAGFMIDGGKKSRPVKSFTIAGNFFDLLKSVAALENKIDLDDGMSNYGSPAALVKGVSVAGK